jgi:hypothetical protein
MLPNTGKTARPKDMTEVEKAWLAAVIDSEGSVVIGKLSEKYGNRKYVAIQVSNTNKEFVDKVRELFGISTTTPHNYNTFKKGVIYQTRISGKVAVLKVLKQVYPYLIIKKEKAKQAIEFLEANPPRPRANNFEKYWKERGIERGKVALVCKDCGKAFFVWRSKIKKFCSRGCYLEWRRKNSKKNLKVS